ncbi:hypothetical protein ACTMJF_23975, partial [Escherichia coli]|uniref:hypothetical protein n=1 Tax=Escherichia coli TaxID=562 RepID=UPI003F8B3603
RFQIRDKVVQFEFDLNSSYYYETIFTVPSEQNTQFSDWSRTLLWIYDHTHRRYELLFIGCTQLLDKRQPETGSSNGWFCYGTVRDVHIGL